MPIVCMSHLFRPGVGLPLGYSLPLNYTPSDNQMCKLMTFLSPEEPHKQAGTD